MREIKFRVWDGNQYSYFKIGQPFGGWASSVYDDHCLNGKTFEQFIGLKDKNGKEIYEGDEVQCRKPYRTTQTHTGDNIPNGSYTEPMEPGIKTISGIVRFVDGMFILDSDEPKEDFYHPLFWYNIQWGLEEIKDSISWTRQTSEWFDDPEEGDLQYLITECAKLETSDQLIEYLSGLEIIGNIHENQERLK